MLFFDRTVTERIMQPSNRSRATCATGSRQRFPNMHYSLFSFLAGRRRALVAASLALAVYAPGLRAQDSSSQIASMSQDIQQLSRQVSQLRVEVETLTQNNADLQKQQISQRDVETMVQNAVSASHGDTRNDITQANTALRKEIVDEVARQIDALTKDTNRQLEVLAKAIQAAPPTAGSASSTGTASTSATTSTAFSDDYPRTGVEYVVQSGDSLAKIAHKLGSTVNDIRNANHIADVNHGLQIGRTIFVPQKNPAPTATAAPTSATPATAQK
jgi:LysM repeat protein